MKHVHLIGIGGTGLAPIARVLHERGILVSGSDRVISPLAQELAALGISIVQGHAAENVRGADAVVRSSAVPESNPEVQEAHRLGIPVYRREEFLSTLVGDLQAVAVAGTHGKTTTTAMLAWCMVQAGLDPSYIIGSTSKNLHSNARAGNSRFFVIEADEYDNMFLGLHPQVAVLTILEHDHPDCFPTMELYRQAFKRFVGQIKPGGLLVTCNDFAETASAGDWAPPATTVLTYGLSEKAEVCAKDVSVNAQGKTNFTVWRAERAVTRVCLPFTGDHNVRNALAVLAVFDQMGWPVEKAAAALGEFQGAGRRFDLLGEAAGVTVIDDYAHHPTEIAATLQAAHARFAGRRIWAVWQPHTYSRTRTLESEFITALQFADQVLVTEIYAARETDPGYSSRQLVEKVNRQSVRYGSSFGEIVATLNSELKPGDVLLVLSAGNANEISVQVLDNLQKKEKKNG